MSGWIKNDLFFVSFLTEDLIKIIVNIFETKNWPEEEPKSSFEEEESGKPIAIKRKTFICIEVLRNYVSPSNDNELS